MSDRIDRIRREQGVGQPPRLWHESQEEPQAIICSRPGRPPTAADVVIFTAIEDVLRRALEQQEHELQMMAALAGTLGDGRMVLGMYVGVGESVYVLVDDATVTPDDAG